MVFFTHKKLVLQQYCAPWYHADEILRCFLLLKTITVFCEQKERAMAAEAPWFLGSYKKPDPALHMELLQQNFEVTEGAN